MTEGVSFLFHVPSTHKVPEVYDDVMVEVNPSCKNHVEALGEDEFIRRESLQQLRDWIAKHPRIKRCRTDAPFLLRFLRTSKFSFMKTARMLECYLHAKTVYRDWFHNFDLEDPGVSRLVDAGYLFPLLQLDKQGRIVFFSCSTGFDPSVSTVQSAIKTNHLIGEIHCDTNEAQCAGLVLVYDMQQYDMTVWSMISIQDVRTLAGLMNNANPLRIQELHFVNTPKVARGIANLVLQLLSDKIRGRVFCHASLKDLHKMVDKAILPKEYGGTVSVAEMVARYKETCWKMRPRLLALDEMELEIVEDCSDLWRNSFQDIGNGAIGSFRKLQVD